MDTFLSQVHSDEYAWRYEEYEKAREEIRQENLQEESRRSSTVPNVQA